MERRVAPLVLREDIYHPDLEIPFETIDSYIANIVSYPPVSCFRFNFAKVNLKKLNQNTNSFGRTIIVVSKKLFFILIKEFQNYLKIFYPKALVL